MTWCFLSHNVTDNDPKVHNRGFLKKIFRRKWLVQWSASVINSEMVAFFDNWFWKFCYAWCLRIHRLLSSRIASSISMRKSSFVELEMLNGYWSREGENNKQMVNGFFFSSKFMKSSSEPSTGCLGTFGKNLYCDFILNEMDARTQTWIRCENILIFQNFVAELM